MKTKLIVTITCPDRPGIVERMTEIVVAHGANWEDSRMARLGGDFAGIVMISVADATVPQLKQALLDLGDERTTVTVKTTRLTPSTPSVQHRMMQLHLSGADHEGIVHKVSAYLAGEGINVEAMDTNVSQAPMSAAPLFHMDAIIKVPGDLGIEQLRGNLKEIADDLGVDIEVRHGER
jgi:glycine cleavage system regulatory protein